MTKEDGLYEKDSTTIIKIPLEYDEDEGLQKGKIYFDDFRFHETARVKRVGLMVVNLSDDGSNFSVTVDFEMFGRPGIYCLKKN